MILGYVLVGMIAGLAALVVSLLLGVSWTTAVLMYPVVGAGVLFLMPLGHLALGRFVPRSVAPSAQPQQGGYAETSHAAPPADQTSPLPMRILAVDDDPFILELIPMIAAKVGFSDITTAASGKEALNALSDTKTTIDCILLDVSMPEMDGIELCGRIRKIPAYRHTPIIMLTAMRDLKNMGHAFRAGATDYATKPFDVTELGTRLKMAQETVQAHQPTYQDGATSNTNLELAAPFSVASAMEIEKVNNLIEPLVLMNYLSHLPRKDVPNVQVFAIRPDQSTADFTSPQSFALRQNLAIATAECIGLDRTLMAFLADGTLLAIAESADLMFALEIETDIETRFAQLASSADTAQEIGISVGGPVHPIGAKPERAGSAVIRATALAAQRESYKQGGAASEAATA
ncbi:response regulator [Oceaniglobus ichthyenteri]|uniref:response regulator n=1 Tax=Oceaniglobus ichthyenteri TaxID=2136177 RepID=UPI000F83B7C6|nr:response regulator [Oceaniglobus ichthyenteri]